MAAVTVGTPAPSRHVWGDLVVRFFVVSGVTGSTLLTGLTNVLWIANQPFTQAGTASLITGLSQTGSPATATFTSSAPMVNEVIMVVSRVG